MIADGRAPPLRSVVGAGFSTLAGARAYTLAGGKWTRSEVPLPGQGAASIPAASDFAVISMSGSIRGSSPGSRSKR